MTRAAKGRVAWAAVFGLVAILAKSIGLCVRDATKDFVQDGLALSIRLIEIDAKGAIHLDVGGDGLITFVSDALTIEEVALRL